MIETIVYGHLKKELSQKVYLVMPERPAREYVTVERTGGKRENQIDYATMVIRSYADSLERAAQINQLVKDSMLDHLIGVNAVGSVYLNADYNLTDEASKKYRYQAVYNITYKEVSRG